MKGRSLEELDELFENRVSVRNFRTYHTAIQDAAVHDVQVNTGAFKEKAMQASGRHVCLTASNHETRFMLYNPT
jgi:hypothetical protein